MKSLIAALSFSLLSPFCLAFELEPLWSIDGFKMPESVVYDNLRDTYYVSNVNEAPFGQDGNGFISRVSENGKHVQHVWVEGMSSPKGLALYENRLYIADVKELIVVDVDKQAVVIRYPLPESSLLNDIAISDRGEVFVSDWTGNAIYTLGDSGLELWFESDKLESPNGLYLSKKHLYVAAWGANPKEDFSTETTGGLKRIELKTKKLEHLTSREEWMNLDGLVPLARNQWLATDFIKGELLNISSRGDVNGRVVVGPSAADLYYVRDKSLVLIPYLMGAKVSAFRLKK
ncbi:MAG: hypothetical protein ACI93R_001749 [Flavobacteriales bacterium]|jgi:hypothetical protein